MNAAFLLLLVLVLMDVEVGNTNDVDGAGTFVQQSNEGTVFVRIAVQIELLIVAMS